MVLCKPCRKDQVTAIGELAVYPSSPWYWALIPPCMSHLSPTCSLHVAFHKHAAKHTDLRAFRVALCVKAFFTWEAVDIRSADQAPNWGRHAIFHYRGNTSLCHHRDNSLPLCHQGCPKYIPAATTSVADGTACQPVRVSWMFCHQPQVGEDKSRQIQPQPVSRHCPLVLIKTFYSFVESEAGCSNWRKHPALVQWPDNLHEVNRCVWKMILRIHFLSNLQQVVTLQCEIIVFFFFTLAELLNNRCCLEPKKPGLLRFFWLAKYVQEVLCLWWF